MCQICVVQQCTNISDKVTAFLGYVQVPIAKSPCCIHNLTLMLRKANDRTKNRLPEKAACFSIKRVGDSYFVKIRYSHGLSVIVSFAERLFCSPQLKLVYVPS